MKWLSNRYVYPFVALAILGCSILQVVWLNELFKIQRVQVKRDLDEVIKSAARQSDYLSVVHGHEKSENFRKFFLSPEWMQIQQSFIQLHARHFGGYIQSHLQPDSTIFTIRFRIPNDKPKLIQGQVALDTGTLKSVLETDKTDLRRMDSLVRAECLRANLDVAPYHMLYSFDKGLPESIVAWRRAKWADYHSQLYTYNYNFFLHTYQLVVQSIDGVVFYRMRFYLISSLLMLLLTIAAFIFLIRVIRTQYMSTQERIAFTSNMTHELKTPVSVIEAALDAITRYQLRKDPAKLENYIDISKTELHRLNLMIDKVLNLDELDNGGVRLRPELYDVQQGLESVVSSMRLRNQQKGASIQYIPADEPCFVNGDPVHLTNVFYNLIDNAWKYSGPDSIIIVACESEADNVHISISDNGPGIEKIYRDRIFERFFRIPNNPDVHNVKGSGLGLHYVRQIIGQHGGKIHLLSEMGKGSTFIIDLPAYYEI